MMKFEFPITKELKPENELIPNINEFLSPEFQKKAQAVFTNEQKLHDFINDLTTEEISKKINKKDDSQVKVTMLAEIKKKVEFYLENYQEINNCQESFTKAQTFGDFLKLSDPLQKLFKKLDTYDLKDAAEAFRFIVNPDYAETRQAEMATLSQAGIYKPYQEAADGGDGWVTAETKDGRVTSLFDSAGHGASQAYKKIFIDKAFSLMPNDPQEKVKFDTFLNDIDESNPNLFLNATEVRAEIKPLNNQEIEAQFEVNGDTGFMLYHPEENKIYGYNVNFPDQNPNLQDLKLKSGTSYGWGFNKLGEKYKQVLPKDAQILLFSDGLKGEKNSPKLYETLDNYLKIAKNTDTKLMDVVKSFVNSPDFKQDDDVTVVEVK